MKKKFFVFGLIIMFLITVSGCSKQSYVEITYDEFKEKIENKDSFALFVGSNQCSHCDDYKITLKKFIKDYQVTVYYIDVAKMQTSELNEFKTVINFSATPTTVFITDGAEKTVYNRIVGALSYSKIEAKFKQAGYIKVK